MGIKLIAIDLDDTLLGRDLKIAERTRDVLRECMGRGIMVTIATGRMLRASAPFAKELGISGPIIAYNGALVADPLSGEVLHHSPIPLEYARGVVAAARRRGLHLNVYINDELYVEDRGEGNEEAEGYSRTYHVPITFINDMIEFLKEEPTKLLSIGRPTPLQDFERELREDFGDLLHLTRSKPEYFEVMNGGVSKGRALALLAERFSLDREEIMAIGDSYNDIEMIEFAGVGIAVANAPDYVKERADYIAPSNDEEGVRWAIEEFLFRRRDSH